MSRTRFTRTAALALAAISPVALGATPGVTTGTYSAGEKVMPIQRTPPAQLSRRFVRSITPQAGRATLDIPSTGKSGLIVLAIPYSADRQALAAGANGQESMVATSLRAPSGRKVLAGEAGSEEVGIRRFRLTGSEANELAIDLPANAQDVFHVASAEAGVYGLEVKAPSDAAAVTVVVAEPESPLTLATTVGPLSRLPGETVTLSAELRDGETPVTDAKVTARLAAPGESAGAPIELTHRGNGLYQAALSALPSQTPGFWAVRFEAEGRDAAGSSFLRTGSSDFMNERGSARFVPDSARARVLRVAGRNVVRITARAQVDQPGDYRFDAILAGEAAEDGSRDGVAWGEATVRLSGGNQKLSIDVPFTGALPQPLHLDVRLLGLDPMGVAGQVEFDLEDSGRGAK